MSQNNFDFTRDTADKILAALRAKGYAIDPGLDDAEIDSVEKAFHASLPPDFKTFLQAGVIRSAPPVKDPHIISNSSFPDWRNPEKEATRCRDWIEEHVFRFDIEKNNYWNEQFGEKPQDLESAVQQALKIVRTWPVLYPIFIHRYICSAPHKMGNPVLSVWQATDTIPYGANLIDYLDREFKLGLGVAKEYPQGIAVMNPEPVPFWSKAFGLE